MPPREPFVDDDLFACHSGRTTRHALIAIYHKWIQILHKRSSVCALFVDFGKAFDIVNHNILLLSLRFSPFWQYCVVGLGLDVLSPYNEGADLREISE